MEQWISIVLLIFMYFVTPYASRKHQCSQFDRLNVMNWKLVREEGHFTKSFLQTFKMGKIPPNWNQVLCDSWNSLWSNSYEEMTMIFFLIIFAAYSVILRLDKSPSPNRNEIRMDLSFCNSSGTKRDETSSNASCVFVWTYLQISRLVGELQLQVNPFRIRYKDLMRMVGFETNVNANCIASKRWFSFQWAAAVSKITIQIQIVHFLCRPCTVHIDKRRT